MKPTELTLPNGTRILLCHDDTVETVTVMILVGAGSAYETENQQGLSHFLEHMCFKGTQKRPTARIISEELESLGAISNAFTDYDYTGYYVKGNPEHVNTFIDVLYDIFTNATLDTQEIEKEKGVIVEEINMYEDDAPSLAAKGLFKLLFGNQAMGRPVIGTKESVRSFSQKDFSDYIRTRYIPQKTVIVVSGKFNATEVGARISETFIASKLLTYQKPVTIIDQSSLKKALTYKQTDQAHIAIGFHSVGIRDPLWGAVSILATILGRGMSSRLFIKLREEMGAAYYVRASTEDFPEYGVFAITAGIDKDRLDIIIATIAEELRMLKETAVSDAELSKAKELSASGIRFGTESSDDKAMFYGIQAVEQLSLRTPTELIEKLKMVRAEDVLMAARRIFQTDNCSLCVVGPYPAERTIQTFDI